MMARKKADLALPTFSGDRFTWTNGVGVVEASDLPCGFASRVWKDACDVGFVVRSHRTGQERLFVFSQVLRDLEGDVIAQVYESPDGTDIHVLND